MEEKARVEAQAKAAAEEKAKAAAAEKAAAASKADVHPNLLPLLYYSRPRVE